MYARVPQVMAQFGLKIVPYHRESPNTRNGARSWSPSPIVAPPGALMTSETRGITDAKIADAPKHPRLKTEPVYNHQAALVILVV